MLNRISIKGRMYLIIGSIFLLFVLMIGFAFDSSKKTKLLAIDEMGQALLEAQKSKLKAATHSMAVAISNMIKDAGSEKEKINIIRKKLSGIRYEEDKSGCFFVFRELVTVAGDLTGNANITADMTSKVTMASGEMSHNLSSVAAAMEESSTNATIVASAAEEMNSTINEIAHNAEKAREISETAATQEIVSNIASLSQGIQEANKNVTSGSESATAISTDIEGVNSATDKMKQSSDLVRQSAGTMSKMAEDMKKIVQLFKV